MVMAEHWEEPSLRRVGAEPGPAAASTQGAVGSGCGTRPLSPCPHLAGLEGGSGARRGCPWRRPGWLCPGGGSLKMSSTFSWLHPPAAGVRSGAGALRTPRGWWRLTRVPAAPKGRAGSVLPALRSHSPPLEAGVCRAVPPHGPGAAAVRCRHSPRQVLVWPEPLPGAQRLCCPASARCGSHPAAQSPRLRLHPPSQPGPPRGSPRIGAVSLCSRSLQTQLCRRCLQCRGWRRSPRPPSRIPRGCCWHHTTPPEFCIHRARCPCPTTPSVPSTPPCHRPLLSGTSPAVGCCSRLPRCVTC